MNKLFSNNKPITNIYLTPIALKMFGPKTWCTKKPFGYRVVHHLDIF